MKPLPTINIEDLQGQTFLCEPEEDGTRHRAKIIKVYEDKQRDNSRHPEIIKLRLSVNNEEFDELCAYNDIINYIEQDHQDEGVWKFHEIMDHEGPFSSGHSKYNGSRYNLFWHPEQTR